MKKHAVRVTGTLDTSSASKPEVVLTVGQAETVTARLHEHDLTKLKRLFGARVVASGMAQFRPSGELLLIDVEHLAVAEPSDALFEAVPAAKSTRSVAPLLAQDDSSGVSAFFGTWPGDESDDELLNALEAVR